VGKLRAGMPKAKPVSYVKPRWEVDRKLNKLTTREQVEKNVQEIKNGNKNSNFSQHAQLERKIKKLRTSEGKANSASAA
jgi:mafB family protein